MNKFEVVSLSDLSVNICQTCSCLYILYRHCLSNISFRLVMFTITISASLHLFCFSCPCLSVSVLKRWLKYLRCVNEYFAGFVASLKCHSDEISHFFFSELFCYRIPVTVMCFYRETKKKNNKPSFIEILSFENYNFPSAITRNWFQLSPHISQRKVLL